ncbi:MAG: radical SAM protein [Verrucomicrobiota bacterium]
MSEQLIFCSDLARRDASGQTILRLEGWCIASRPICAFYLENPTSGCEMIPFGFARPDVKRAYPEYPNAENSGFRLSTNYQPMPDWPTRLCVQIEMGGGEREFRWFPVNFETHDVQTFELNEKTGTRADRADAGRIDEDLPIENRLQRSLTARRGLTLRLDIINKCNLRCVMCHFSDDAIFKRPTKQFTTDEFKALFREIGPHIREVILSCGDEPLTSKYLPEILYYLADEHPEVAIEFCTNAMLMRAPIRKAIMETGVARLLFSVDAVSAPLLESIRVGCRYEQLLGNILALRDLKEQWHACFPSFVFNFVMMTRNIHEAPAFVHLAKSLGADSIDFRHVVAIETYFDPTDLLSSQPAKYNYYREKIIEQARAWGVNYYLPLPFETAEQWEPFSEPEIALPDFRRVTPDPAGSHQPRFVPARVAQAQSASWEGSAAEEFSTTFCARPFSEIMVRDQEEVLPCPWHRKTLGRLSEGKKLPEIFFGEDFARLRRNMFKPEGDPNCAGCPIKSAHLPTRANT